MSMTLFCLLIKRRNQMSLAYLKVKIKSLAAEARIIRHEEEVWRHRETERGRPTFFGLRSHRKLDVRTEARAAQLAYAFLRGRPYSHTEPTGKDNGSRQSNPIDWVRVTKLAAKYGADRTLEWPTVKEWVAPQAEAQRVPDRAGTPN
jgi:hypothetical protein